MGDMNIGLSKLTAGDWTCDVCHVKRPYDEIDTATHVYIDANGVETDENVKYCKANPMCKRTAHLRSLTSLAYLRAVEERREMSQRLFAVTTSRPMWAFGAFVAGFLIRGAI